MPMNHGHGQASGRGPTLGHSAAGHHRWRLAVAFGLILAFFGVELATGLLSGSLALISDAGHMAADVVTLGAALVATRLATRPDTTGRRTYGSYRAEVFASGLAVLVMLAVSVYIVVEAIGRLGAAPEPAARAMLAVGALGLVINLVALALLHGGAAESLNVRGAYLEVLADSVGSIGVIAAGVLVSLTRNPLWDTLIAVAIAVFVALRAIALGREVLAVLGQHAPSGLEPGHILQALSAVPGVAEVHDLHVWMLTSGMNVATVHLVLDDGTGEPGGRTAAGAPSSGAVLAAAGRLLREEFGIAHATIQLESPDGRECHGADW